MDTLYWCCGDVVSVYDVVKTYKIKWQAFLIATTCDRLWGVWNNLYRNRREKLTILYHQNHALGPKIDSVFVHTKLSKTSTCLRKFHFHKTKWDRKCHQSCSKRPVSAVNAISVRHNLVFCGCGLTFRGSPIVYFCILRDDEKISVLKKACHMVCGIYWGTDSLGIRKESNFFGNIFSSPN